ncbi:hypothetical protein [Chitinophaga sp. Ak27]|uniref:hypothetical protein n=1 Tax=Chitinophaga sp. Ak27 TaxID=2726116 RepID=UPI00145DCD63|nr:hypothetical protein [Chitinophaga sp. Ak27]NLU93058.1 hypothetical protein [Chitinophaga sp. Ak27]
MKYEKSGNEIFTPSEPPTVPPQVPENPGKSTETPVITPIHEPVPLIPPSEVPAPEKNAP